MFNTSSKRETIYGPINGLKAAPSAALAENHYQRSVRRQIERLVKLKVPSSYFDEIADLDTGRLLHGAKPALIRDINRNRAVAAALRKAGL